MSDIQTGELHSSTGDTHSSIKMRINDIAITMSYSSRADPGLRVAFKYLNV